MGVSEGGARGLDYGSHKLEQGILNIVFWSSH